MFHLIESASALPNLELVAVFYEGVTKKYDVKPLLDKFPSFEALNNESLFNGLRVDTGGYGVVWNEDIDLSCNTIWYGGEPVPTAFDNLISFGDASRLWNLNESTLRKAVAARRLMPNIDARKYGKQWLVTRAAMEREYGALAS